MSYGRVTPYSHEDELTPYSQPSGNTAVADDELQPSQTEGYKVGAQKTLQEYAQLDAGDESLRKWKESLGITAEAAGSGKTKVTVHSLALHSPSRKEPLTLDVADPEKVSAMKKNPGVLKEGAEYQVEIKFTVEGGVASGLRYLQVVKRAGITVDKDENMIGSYGPSADEHVKRFESDEAPSGMIARTGVYNARSRVVDDDNQVWLDFEWAFVIRKDW